MKNSLRKKLKRVITKYDLLRIYIRAENRQLERVCIRFRISNYIKLKYEYPDMTLIHTYGSPTDVSYTSVVNKKLQVLKIDKDYYQTEMKPILDIFIKLNQKTYKIDKISKIKTLAVNEKEFAKTFI